MALQDPASAIGLMFAAKADFEGSALRFTQKELSGKNHPYELPRTNHTVVSVDQGSRGTGGGSCGPQTLAQYQLHANDKYEYSFSIIPYLKADTDIMEISRL
jgi:beta-galactosidase